MAGYETLLTATEDGIAVVTFNRPDVRNALNRAVLGELREVLAAAASDPDVDALIFTGSGEKAFVAGADINQLQKNDLHTGLEAQMQHLFDEIEAFPKPTIAAINGLALGGGCELAMACDIRVAASHAGLGLPELHLAIIPGAGGTQRLARLVGVGRAVEMILTGRVVPVEEAQAMGLISAIVTPEELLEHSRSVARSITRKGPLAVRLAKLVIRSGMDTDRRTGQVIERLAQSLLYTTEDKREGTEAFLAKRRPTFKGQ